MEERDKKQYKYDLWHVTMSLKKCDQKKMKRKVELPLVLGSNASQIICDGLRKTVMGV